MTEQILQHMPAERVLLLIRGLPGSGKTTLAKILAPNTRVAADDFFTTNGRYEFDAGKIGEAHAWCQRIAEQMMKRWEPVVAVHNTFSQPWEAEPYHQLAGEYGYSVFIIEAQNQFGTKHGVPPRQQDQMRDRWTPLLPRPVYNNEANTKV
jgi:predicted kinase